MTKRILRLHSLLGQLSSDLLRQVATMKMEGFTAPEIGQKLGISERSVQRKLSVIRGEWLEAGRQSQ